MNISLKTPNPDINEFKDIVLRKKISRKVHFGELHFDKEVIEYITKNILEKKWVEPVASDKKTQEICLKNFIECWYKLGFDFVRQSGDFRFGGNLHFTAKTRRGQDTADLSRTTRQWVEEGKGIISDWQDFEKYSWPSADDLDLWSFEFVSKNLPEGMGMFVCISQGILEVVLNTLLGFENFSFFLYDNPDIIKAIFDKVGEIIYKGYEKLIGLDKMTGFFQGDDFGFKTSTLVPPKILKDYVLPWHKKIAELAHKNNLIYIFHSCGYLEPVIEDLIEDVKIDVKHSFEDAVIPVTEFKEKYGKRIGVMGGVDVDKICRMEEKELRKYVRNILDKCMPDGGYILGSGNSVTNYMPISNYLTVLDEGDRWK
ncbi:MAG: hypothetical protein M1135_03240 [Candidatus Omnitrophica bacterium]|jgi:uroporphyrinogen decarboxylase|nr:hypothetical protein [Candidatus Omnitrophota bacterium]